MRLRRTPAAARAGHRNRRAVPAALASCIVAQTDDRLGVQVDRVRHGALAVLILGPVATPLPQAGPEVVGDVRTVACLVAQHELAVAQADRDQVRREVPAQDEVTQRCRLRGAGLHGVVPRDFHAGR